MTSRPSGSTATLTGLDFYPQFTADTAGTYIVRAVATDAAGVVSAPSEIKITCLPRAYYLYNWQMRTPPSFTSNLNDIAYGNGAFATVGNGGSIVYSRDDGLTWTRATTGTTSDLRAVIFASNLFVAVGNGGTILTSPDAVTWIPRASGLPVDLRAVAYGNNRFVAVGGQAVALSVSGTSWSGSFVDTSGGSGGTMNLNSIAFGNGMFAAGGNGAIVGDYGRVLKSSDGVAWTSASFGADEFHTVGFGAGHFLMSQSIYEWLSSDLQTWVQSSPATEPWYYFDRIRYSGGLFFSFWTNDSPGLVDTSWDGITWYGRTTGATGRLTSAAFGAQHYVVVGENGSILQSDSIIAPSTGCALQTNFEGSPIGGTITAYGPGTRQYIIGSFTPAASYSMTAADFWVWRVSGTPSFSVTAFIYTDDGNKPGALLAASTNSVDAASLTDAWNGGPYRFSFPGAPLAASARYWIGLGTNGPGDPNNCIAIGLNNTTGQGASQNLYVSNRSASWSHFSTLYSVRFRTYSGDCGF